MMHFGFPVADKNNGLTGSVPRTHTLEKSDDSPSCGWGKGFIFRNRTATSCAILQLLTGEA